MHIEQILKDGEIKPSIGQNHSVETDERRVYVSTMIDISYQWAEFFARPDAAIIVLDGPMIEGSFKLIEDPEYDDYEDTYSPEAFYTTQTIDDVTFVTILRSREEADKFKAKLDPKQRYQQ